LQNMSPDPNDEYFADGMTEELISAISNVSGLSVISRTSVMQYKKPGKKLADIGEDLRVGTILEGSVRKFGNKVRVAENNNLTPQRKSRSEGNNSSYRPSALRESGTESDEPFKCGAPISRRGDVSTGRLTPIISRRLASYLEPQLVNRKCPGPKKS